MLLFAVHPAAHDRQTTVFVVHSLCNGGAFALLRAVVHTYGRGSTPRSYTAAASYRRLLGYSRLITALADTAVSFSRVFRVQFFARSCCVNAPTCYRSAVAPAAMLIHG